MPRYQYRARTLSGQMREGHHEALSPDGVAEFLERAQLMPVEVREVPERVDIAPKLRKLLRMNRVSLPDLVLFSRQMYALTKAGIPVNRALSGLRGTTENESFAESLGEVESDLDSGRSLSESLQAQSHIFPSLMISIVKVGEEAGQLPQAFEKIHGYLAFEYETTRKVKGALRYPMIVLSASAIAVAVLVGFVVPQFAGIFSRFRVELPLPTRIMLGAADFVTNYWWAVLAGLFVMVVMTRSILRTPAGRMAWDRMKFRMPVLGPIVLYSSLARYCRGLAISYASGVSVVTSMHALAQAVGNVHLTSAIDTMREMIEAGEPLSRAAESQALFTPLVVQMLAVGEETGRIDEMMTEVADFYEHEVEYRIENLGAAIEPLLLFVLGGLVLIIALAVFLPMWDLVNVSRR